MIKHRKSGFFRIAAAILMICFTLFGLTACAGTTDSKDNNDDNALIQGTWEIDTGSGAGYKFVDDTTSSSCVLPTDAASERITLEQTETSAPCSS